MGWRNPDSPSVRLVQAAETYSGSSDGSLLRTPPPAVPFRRVIQGASPKLPTHSSGGVKWTLKTQYTSVELASTFVRIRIRVAENSVSKMGFGKPENTNRERLPAAVLSVQISISVPSVSRDDATRARDSEARPITA